MGEAWSRFVGTVRLALRRLFTGGAASPQQVRLSVSSVAVAIALMLVVTGLSLGLVTDATVQSDDTDYWVVPDAGSGSSSVVSVDGPRFGDVHRVSAGLTTREDVTHATPVLVDVLRFPGEGDDAQPEYVLAVGVVPGEHHVTISGVSTRGLTPGDPHFADGSYAGPWTGEAVVSAGAAETIGVSQGGSFTPASANRSFSAVRVSEATGADQLPVVLVHLSELQVVAGATSGDQADQLLVATDSRDVKSHLEGLYPHSSVVTRGGIFTPQLLSEDVPVSVAVTALLVALVIGTLSIATTMGLAVAADQRDRAVLAAIGISRRSRSVLLVTQTLTVALLGGIGGIILGVGGIFLVNELVAPEFGLDAVAAFDVILVPYALGVSVLIGVLSVPYLLALAGRTTNLEVLGE
ncbi:FtsX-like permease family protein [Haladaptatus sp. QDMS2]|uniref:FtsX-like permease family protein n=1 Tax=Haladaptatus sp. QDMS2 TaxID=3033391 RepID=UPI0023E8B4AC|nr:ABC transporter permease [Haladaptatus sp. QDMS2]